LAGEVELDRLARMAITQKDVSVLVGWTPEQQLGDLVERLKTSGAAVVELPMPPGAIPPTLLRTTKIGAPFRVLVDTYGVPPYSDVDPTAFAAIAFIVMFGMMFGDVGHGLLLVAFSAVLSRARHGRLARLRPSWPLVASAGVSSSLFGLFYGEFFGPTGIVPTLWIAPLDAPLTLLKAALVVGATLLAISYVLGASNRWRERGLGAALYAEGGLAGALVFSGVAAAALGWMRESAIAKTAGLVLAAFGVALLFAGTLAQAGRGAGGITRGVIEIMDALIRIGSNVISFTRLAAFGMTHAAVSSVTLEGARHLAGGVLGWILAALLFLVGTAVAVTLEGLVAAIQALRLEYYELFSRIFAEEGLPFKPFTLPVRSTEDKI
ncbi:MAG: V-type ATPase 116kDa subunit family protein, partial [Gemmatimonadaceae bacterium]